MSNRNDSGEGSRLPARRQASRGSRFHEVASGGVRDLQDLGRIVSATFSDFSRGVIGDKAANTITRMVEGGCRVADGLARNGNTVLDPDVPPLTKVSETLSGEQNTGNRSQGGSH